MEQEPLHQPHDKLLKATLSNLENARSFFELFLPPDILAHVQWDSLNLLPSSFIAPNFAASESDLLFSVNLGETPSLIYLLLEHQSSEDPRIALRLLAYIVRIWERFTQSNPPSVKLPPVFPLVLVQNKTPWKTSPRLADLIEKLPFLQEDGRDWQPAFEFCMAELAQTPFQDFTGSPESVLMLRLLKAAAGGLLLSDWVWDAALLERVSESALELWVRYITHADINRSALIQRLKNLEKIMTTKPLSLARQLVEFGRKEGFHEGMEKGRVEAAREAVLQALEIKHGRVSPALYAKLEAISDLSLLRKLHEQAFLTGSEREFMRSL